MRTFTPSEFSFVGTEMERLREELIRLDTTNLRDCSVAASCLMISIDKINWIKDSARSKDNFSCAKLNTLRLAQCVSDGDNALQKVNALQSRSETDKWNAFLL